MLHSSCLGHSELENLRGFPTMEIAPTGRSVLGVELILSVPPAIVIRSRRPASPIPFELDFSSLKPMPLSWTVRLTISSSRLKFHPNLAGLRVFDDIGQGFLQGTIERNVVGIRKLRQRGIGFEDDW